MKSTTMKATKQYFWVTASQQVSTYQSCSETQANGITTITNIACQDTKGGKCGQLHNGSASAEPFKDVKFLLRSDTRHFQRNFTETKQVTCHP